MSEYLQIVLDRAFESFPGEFYNHYREEVAERLGRSFLFYEISLMEPTPWSRLRDLIYPNFVRYLRVKHRDHERGSGVTVAVFAGERCHLLKGEDFLAIYREMEGLDTVAFNEKVHQWLSRSQAATHSYPVTISNPRR